MAYKQIDTVAIELGSLSHAEFRRKYMVSRHVTEEEVWAQVPQTTTTPDEREHHVVLCEGAGLAYPSEIPLIRTWGVRGWK